ncbi:MAG: 50S ribosomal protein L19 [Planctomycetota bacterium]|nr:50S ribosomal protein L19 [Planctomycetota bacterium]
MTSLIIEEINKSQLKSGLPNFLPGDTINVYFRIVEGDKERAQMFQGVCLSRHGRGINEMAVVRKIVDSVGVERIFPLNSPLVAKVEIVRRADARRAKLYYLRDRLGKSRRLRDQRRGIKHNATDGVPIPGQDAAARDLKASTKAAAAESAKA